MKPRNGYLVWLLLGAFVLAWDLAALARPRQVETLSGAVHRGMDHRAARPLIVAGAAVLVAHLLLHRAFRRVDPIHAHGRALTDAHRRPEGS